MRALTPGETDVIRWFAVREGESAGLRLLEDLDDTKVEEIRNEHLRLRFHLSGRSPLGFEDTYPASFASALDADGGSLVLILWLDLDGTLYELHVSRVDAGPVQRPDWSNLRAMPREEFARLLKLSDAADSATPSRVHRWLRRLTGRCT